MHVTIESITEQYPLWRKIYTEDSGSHFFQSPEWSSLISTYLPNMSAAHFAIHIDNRTYIIPLIRSKKFGGLFSTMMSLPLGTTGGILSEHPIDSEVVQKLIQHIKRTCPLKITLRCQNEQLKSLLEPYGRIEQINALTLNLDRPYNQIEEELFSRNKRKLVNRGRRRGVIIGNTKCPEHVDAYCILQRKVEQQKGWVTKFSESFIRKMIALNEADLWTAWIDNQLACAIVSFSYHGTVTAWQGILDRGLGEILTAQPMNLLYASMIQYYQEQNCQVFDMGNSLGIASLELYKRGFGCKETPMYFFTSENPLFRVGSAIRRIIPF
jgi:hypothetical protein